MAYTPYLDASIDKLVTSVMDVGIPSIHSMMMIMHACHMVRCDAVDCYFPSS